MQFRLGNLRHLSLGDPIDVGLILTGINRSLCLYAQLIRFNLGSYQKNANMSKLDKKSDGDIAYVLGFFAKRWYILGVFVLHTTK